MAQITDDGDRITVRTGVALRLATLGSHDCVVVIDGALGEIRTRRRRLWVTETEQTVPLERLDRALSELEPVLGGDEPAPELIVRIRELIALGSRPTRVGDRACADCDRPVPRNRNSCLYCGGRPRTRELEVAILVSP